MISASQIFSNKVWKWLAQVDSNHRPRAYQARALTTWAMSQYLSISFQRIVFWVMSFFKALWLLRKLSLHYVKVELFWVHGGDDGIRTHDPLLAGQVLSQLSYTPVYCLRQWYLLRRWNHFVVISLRGDILLRNVRFCFLQFVRTYFASWLSLNAKHCFNSLKILQNWTTNPKDFTLSFGYQHRVC